MRRRAQARRSRALVLLVLALLAAAVVALALAGTASADAWSPEAGPSSNAVKTDTLYKIVFFTGIGMIALVWGVLFYSLVRFRARRGRTAPQIRGNTTLELAWTLGATALVVVLAVITLVMLGDIRDPARSGPTALADAQRQNADLNQPPVPGSRGLTIEVSGQQYIWRYRYPNGAVSFQQMVAPKDTTVVLKIQSNDVAHSWWVPKLGPKQDAIPGYTNQTWFKATKTGTFGGQCAEFCGDNHAFMTAKVTVVEPAVYQRWVENQKTQIEQAQKEAVQLKKRLQGDQSQPTGGS
jgi:cytochrome c oxidase subunit 2